MELKEISLFEAKMNDMPAGEPGEGEISIWYALEDEGKYKGYMEITQYDDISEISYYMVPDIYRGNGYGALMLEKFLDYYIPRTKPESMLTTFFEYNVGHGDELFDIISGYGFDISLSSVKECSIPFEIVYEKLSSKKPAVYKGRMMNLTEGLGYVLDNLSDLKDMDITERDIRESSCELSVAAIDAEGKLEGLLLVSVPIDRKEIVVTNLYTVSDSITFTIMLLAFAAENAYNSTEPPQFVNFAAADEKLEKMMDSLFDNPKTSDLILADGEFNLEKYIEQLKLMDSIGR